MGIRAVLVPECPPPYDPPCITTPPTVPTIDATAQLAATADIIATSAQSVATAAQTTATAAQVAAASALAAISAASGSTRSVASGGTGLSTVPAVGQVLVGNGSGYVLAAQSIGLASTINAIVANTTLTSANRGQFITVSGGVAINLPVASTVLGMSVGFIFSGTGCSLLTSGGNIYGGGLNVASISPAPSAFISVQADGGGWRIISASPDILGYPTTATVMNMLPLTGGGIAAAGVYTNTQMNDTLKVSVNGASNLTEFQWSHPGNYNTTALSTAIIVPPSSSVYASSGFASYVQNQSTSAAGATAGYFYARNTVAGGTVFGLNPLVTDQNAGGTDGVASTVVGAEFDVGAFNPLTKAYGINMLGVFPNGTPLGAPAYQVAVLNAPWRYGLTIQDGGAITAINIGSATTSANSDGQPINMAARDASNTGHLVAIQAVHAASGANLFFNTPTGGVIMSGLELVGGTASFLAGVGVTAAAGVLEQFFSGATLVGSISTNGTSTTYNTTSDYRLKDLHGLADGSLIDRILIYTASFKTDSTVRRSMMLAHEVQTEAPWAVSGTKDAVYADDISGPTGKVVHRKGEAILQMVDHSALIPDLIAKCQALQNQITVMSQEIAQMKAGMR